MRLFRSNPVKTIPMGLQFVGSDSRIAPKKIKAVVQDPCPQQQAEFDRELRTLAGSFPPIEKCDPSSFPTVRAVNYEGNPVDLVSWLNRVYSGELFPSNERIKRQPLLDDASSLTNHELWMRVSEVLSAEFYFTADQPASYKPRVDQMVFRDKADFFGGSWHFFRQYWEPFIDLIEDDGQKDEIRESLRYGVDTASCSRPHKFMDIQGVKNGEKVSTGLKVYIPSRVKENLVDSDRLELC